jgi:hypothetical protein
MLDISYYRIKALKEGEQNVNVISEKLAQENNNDMV